LLACSRRTQNRILAQPIREVGLAPMNTEHLAKVGDCLSRRLTDAMVDGCVALAVNVDRLNDSEVGELLAIAGVLH
jgi:hypothetical protein